MLLSTVIRYSPYNTIYEIRKRSQEDTLPFTPDGFSFATPFVLGATSFVVEDDVEGTVMGKYIDRSILP